MLKRTEICTGELRIKKRSVNHCTTLLQSSSFLMLTAAHTVFIGQFFFYSSVFCIIFLAPSCNGYKNCHNSEGYPPDRTCTESNTSISTVIYISAIYCNGSFPMQLNLTLYVPCIVFQYVDKTNEMQHFLWVIFIFHYLALHISDCHQSIIRSIIS